MWGWNSCGQLGLEEISDKVFVTKPTRLVLTKSYFTSEEVKFKEASLGSRHTAFVDVEDSLYTCGWNKYEQLVHENINQFDDVNIEEPSRVESFEGKTRSVKCGSWFTAIGLNNWLVLKKWQNYKGKHFSLISIHFLKTKKYSHLFIYKSIIFLQYLDLGLEY